MSVKSACRMNGRSEASSSRLKFPAGEYTIHKPHECKQVLKNRPIHLKRCAYDGKEITHAVEKGGLRKMLIPSKEPTIYPLIMKSDEFREVQERSHNETREERERALAAAEREKERLMRESMKRKESIWRMDLRKTRKRQGRLNEIEEEARQRTMHLLERANAMRLEDEEEIKKCNKLILETKCRAIRDAQIAEKRQLEHEQRLEERRVNELMEQERIQALKIEEQRQLVRAERQQSFARVLKEQIDRNEEERALEYERKREESRLINMNSIAQQEAQLERIKEREEDNLRARRELLECNEQLKHFKAMEKEENRIIEMRIQQFHREKAEREAKIMEEIRQEQLRKEREKERVAEQAQQANELQAQIDELNASRIQEEVEREWRRKEKEEALKRVENLKRLRDERERQINSKMMMEAMEVENEKREFQKLLLLQKEAICREEKEREKKRKAAFVHRCEILKQVNEKEKQRIVSRQKMFEEGLAIRAESDQHKKRLRNAMERKCQEMRENKVPDMYINEVKNLIDNIK